MLFRALDRHFLHEFHVPIKFPYAGDASVPAVYRIRDIPPHTFGLGFAISSVFGLMGISQMARFGHFNSSNNNMCESSTKLYIYVQYINYLENYQHHMNVNLLLITS